MSEQQYYRRQVDWAIVGAYQLTAGGSVRLASGDVVTTSAGDWIVTDGTEQTVWGNSAFQARHLPVTSEEIAQERNAQVLASVRAYVDEMETSLRASHTALDLLKSLIALAERNTAPLSP